MFVKFYKQKGDYSNKRIRALAKELQVNKIGHLGILDPLAEGLMIVATDEDTRLLEYIDDKTKVYKAKAKLFLTSDTLDIMGFVQNTEVFKITNEEFLAAINKAKEFKTQIPPLFSAKKINGKKAYQYARENKEIELNPQEIQINHLELINYDIENHEFEIIADVSHGTYIRTLLCDIAKLLNTTCIMTELKRLSIGKVKLSKLEPNEFKEINHSELFNLPILNLNEGELKLLENGDSFKVNLNDAQVFAFNPFLEQICAVGQITNKIFYPKKVFPKRCLWKN
ncbi:tRNA pseudouridine(55) synthase TruB [Mycoplasmopsis bovirhinis]|uniref:tRNA pseudouridine(55) synthase TruB n=1 Tax=Mycoplasmopsis bovirhinis TaxID=29553 RepID=UPI000C05B603|nr:tRNA pseudouridine(55) synthase TruB [Mycoplasmopsis bovirhinis]ATO31064.1 tRNA pseudouridine(55) synthase TruB [Mycoplasmopsis bovirhinis]